MLVLNLQRCFICKNLEEWGKKLDVVLTVDGAEEGYKGNIGLVTKYIPELKFNDLSNVSAVVVGPPMMMKFSVAEFLKLNVAEKIYGFLMKEICTVV